VSFGCPLKTAQNLGRLCQHRFSIARAKGTDFIPSKRIICSSAPFAGRCKTESEPTSPWSLLVYPPSSRPAPFFDEGISTSNSELPTSNLEPKNRHRAAFSRFNVESSELGVRSFGCYETPPMPPFGLSGARPRALKRAQDSASHIHSRLFAGVSTQNPPGERELPHTATTRHEPTKSAANTIMLPSTCLPQ
jgi:hypothetical protein